MTERLVKSASVRPPAAVMRVTSSSMMAASASSLFRCGKFSGT